MRQPPAMAGSLVLLVPHADRAVVSHGSVVLVTARDGFVRGEAHEGLFVDETRLLSRWRWTLRGAPPEHVLSSNVEPNAWHGWYAAPSRPGRDVAQSTLALEVARRIDGAFEERVVVTNHGLDRASAELRLELASDFGDQAALAAGRRDATGGRTIADAWTARGARAGELRVEHRRRARRADREPHLVRGYTLEVRATAGRITRRPGALVFALALAPRRSATITLRLVPHVRDLTRYPPPRTRAAVPAPAEPTTLDVPRHGPLAAAFADALDRAARDLSALRLPAFDRGPRAWVPAAGLPTYVALFGRDTIVTARHAALLGPEILAGVVDVLAAWQGTRVDDFRDEAPGRVLHEAHAAPLSMLHTNPRDRYYGSVTASALYVLALCDLWRWTGDAGRVRRHLANAERALAYLDRCADLGDRGLYSYATRSPQGLRNQGWKDSDDAMVDERGRQAPLPIATCEAQAKVYAAKRALAGLLEALGREERARALRRDARALAARFDRLFWVPALGTYAMAIDGRNRQLRSIASDPGHALLYGIALRGRRRAVADRLLAPDLFSGWGVRTLSAAHPAYDPFSYHRGSVWPVEQAILARGLAACGFYAHAERIVRAQVEASRLFAHARLPEVMSGHAKDAHPFPALYPRTDWPQAWSAASLVAHLETFLGVAPDAPSGRLVLRPRLPPWLPEVTLHELRVGRARVTLRFVRDAPRTVVEVVRRRGELDVVCA